MVSPTILPVCGSCGPAPETKTRPTARTAWLYVGGGDGALAVWMMSLAILLHGWLRGQFTSHPSQEREGWGNRVCMCGLELEGGPPAEGWGTRLLYVVWKWKGGPPSHSSLCPN